MNHRHLDVWNPNDALPWPFPILSSDYALPEKLITHLAFWLGFMEKLAKTFGNLAFIWATVILLGGFVSVLAIIDFWFITIILVIEGVRILSHSRVLKWQYDLAAEVTFGHPRFLKNIIHLFYWLQNISVILCMILSLIRLLQKDIKSQGGKNQDSALLLFYTLVMIESIILILENSYYFWKIHDDKLFQQICNECGLIFDDAYSLRLFFYDAYSKCISGSIIDVLKMNLISFAKNCLDSRFIKKQIIGARILGQFIKNERLADDTLRRIGNSTQTIERLIEMLNWKNPNEYEIRFFATLIVSKMVSRQYYALKVIEIPGAMESIRSLFAFVDSIWTNPNMTVSPLWRELRSIAIKFKRRFLFRVGINSEFSLFHDHWCEGKSLRELLGMRCYDIMGYPPDAPLSSCLDAGKWRIPPLLGNMHCDIAAAILKICIYNEGDGIYWGNCPTFKNSIIKNDLFDEFEKVDWFNNIWFKGFSVKHALYCWLAMVGGLKTADLLSSRGVSVNPICCLCRAEYEAKDHLFFRCSFSQWLIKMGCLWGISLCSNHPYLRSWKARISLIQTF